MDGFDSLQAACGGEDAADDDPDEVIDDYGADTFRLYEMFMGPLDKGAPWSDEAIPGLHRFLPS